MENYLNLIKGLPNHNNPGFYQRLLESEQLFLKGCRDAVLSGASDALAPKGILAKAQAGIVGGPQKYQAAGERSAVLLDLAAWLSEYGMDCNKTLSWQMAKRLGSLASHWLQSQATTAFALPEAAWGKLWHDNYSAISWLSALSRHHECNMGAIRDLLHFFSAPKHPREIWRDVEIKVALVKNDKGLIAVLRLETRPRLADVGGIYADPLQMAFVSFDEAFRSAAKNAWSYVAQTSFADVAWSLRMYTPASIQNTDLPLQIHGGSLGAAFAVGLLHLLDVRKPALETGWVITGGVNVKGQIQTVAGCLPKLFAAHQMSLKAVLPVIPEDNPIKLYLKDWEEVMAELVPAETVKAASDIMGGHLMEVVTAYLEQFASEQANPPVYYPASLRQTTFEHIRQPVRVRKPGPQNEPEREDDEPFDWPEMAGQLRLGVILSDAGFGKTRLLRYEGWRSARHELNRLKQGQAGVEQVRVPIFLRLPVFAAKLAAYNNDPLHTIVETVAEDYQAFLPAGRLDKFKEWLRGRLEARAVLLLLDGLDEVLHPTEDFYRALKQLANLIRTAPTQTPAGLSQSPSPQILLTSRPVAYTPVFDLNGPAERELELTGFGTEEITGFVKAWFAAPEQLETRAQLLAKLSQEPDLGNLARIPVLLSFICLLGESGQTLPTRRNGLFAKVLNHLLQRYWHEPHQQQKDKGLVFNKLRTLEEIAWHCATAQGRWSDYFRLDDPQVSHDLVNRLCAPTPQGESLLQELSQRDGVLIAAGTAPNGDDFSVPYLFLHRTFQEYLVASYLAQRTPEERLTAVQKYCWHPHWWETLPLLAGKLFQTNGPASYKKVEQLIQVLLHAGPDIFHSMQLLAGKCVAELDWPPDLPLPALAQEVSRAVIDLCFAGLPPDCKRAHAVGRRLGHVASQRVVEHLRGKVGGSRQAIEIAAQIGCRTDEVISVLLEYLDSPAMCREAAAALGQFGEALDAKTRTRVVDKLSKCLQRPALKATARHSMIRALGQLQTHNADALLQYLDGKDAGARQAAGRALSYIKVWDEASMNGLLAFTKHPDAVVRKSLASALSRLENANEAIKESLLALAEDSDDGVRRNAILALARLKADSPQVKGKLIEFSDTPSPLARWAAIRAVGHLQIRDEAAITKLLAVLEDAEDGNAADAAEILGRLGVAEERVCEGLLVFLDAAPSPDGRQAAVWALRKLGFSNAAIIAKLCNYLLDPDTEVRLTVLATLRQLGVANADMVEKLLQPQAKIETRRIALEMLGQVGFHSGRVAAVLREALKDERLRQVAAFSLAYLGVQDDEIVKNLLAALNDAEPLQRRIAAAFLGRLRSPDVRLTRALQDALNDPDQLVREAAVSALLTVFRTNNSALREFMAWAQRHTEKASLELYTLLYEVSLLLWCPDPQEWDSLRTELHKLIANVNANLLTNKLLALHP